MFVMIIVEMGMISTFINREIFQYDTEIQNEMNYDWKTKFDYESNQK